MVRAPKNMAAIVIAIVMNLPGMTLQPLYSMGKACCAVGCSNRFIKSLGVHFYRFPQDEERKSRWIAAVGRKDWTPN